jgi:1,4-alpha-glucan branching enzyme
MDGKRQERDVARIQADAWQAEREDVEALIQGTHRDPHRVLGVHKVPSGAVVRAWRPEAEQVEVLLEAGTIPAERTADEGLFEARMDDMPEPAGYRLRVTYQGGSTFELRDPYAFWPTFGDIDLHLAGEGRHEELWRRMGAHCVEVDGVAGVAFAVWAPNARSVRVVGDFNSWDGRLHPMRMLGGSGIWELFVPDIGPGEYYKYEIVTAQGALVTRADPYAFATDVPPGTASRVFASTYEWNDDAVAGRPCAARPADRADVVYEVHLGSWRQHPDGTPYSYREVAHALGRPRRPSWASPTSSSCPSPSTPSAGHGAIRSPATSPRLTLRVPDDFRYLVDHLHQRGIGVIVDWVPAHFPRDEWALARFDGTALYEHLDPRKGAHPDWGTLVFNFGRNEVRNFLIANALYWLEELHVDGLRVDAVASMLYLDYSRAEGEWIPNVYGGRENLEAVEFLKEFNAVVYGRNPASSRWRRSPPPGRA